MHIKLEMMNYSNKYRLCLLLISMLFFSSVQSVFAGEMMMGSGDHAINHSMTLSHADNSTMVLADIAQTGHDDHCDTSSDNASLLCGSCNFCAHCFACIPDILVISNSNKTIAVFPLTSSISYLYLPLKDRPPRA